MRYLLTRPLAQSSAIKGAEVICLPLLEITAPADKGGALKNSLKKIYDYDWLVLTSPNGVRAVSKITHRLPEKLKVVTVGEVTAKLAKKLTKNIFVPQKNLGAKGLIPYFEKQKLKGKKILYPRSQIANDDLLKFLKKGGAQVDVVVAYQTRRTKVSPADLKKIFQKKIDKILFYSPSAVRHFFDLQAIAGVDLRNVELIPFGPTTAKEILKFRG